MVLYSNQARITPPSVIKHIPLCKIIQHHNALHKKKTIKSQAFFLIFKSAFRRSSQVPLWRLSVLCSIQDTTVLYLVIPPLPDIVQAVAVSIVNSVMNR